MGPRRNSSSDDPGASSLGVPRSVSSNSSGSGDAFRYDGRRPPTHADLQQPSPLHAMVLQLPRTPEPNAAAPVPTTFAAAPPFSRVWEALCTGDAKTPLRLRPTTTPRQLADSFGSARAHAIALAMMAPNVRQGFAQASERHPNEASWLGSILLHACLRGRFCLSNGSARHPRRIGDSAEAADDHAIQAALLNLALQLIGDGAVARVPEREASPSSEAMPLTAFACALADEAALKALVKVDRGPGVYRRILASVQSWQTLAAEDVERLLEQLPELRQLCRRGAREDREQADKICEYLLSGCLSLQVDAPRVALRPVLQLFADVALRAKLPGAFNAVLAQAQVRHDRSEIATQLLHRTLSENFHAGALACLAAGADAMVRRGHSRCRRLSSGFTPLHTLAASAPKDAVPHDLLQALLEAGAQPRALAEAPAQMFCEPMQPVCAVMVAHLTDHDELAGAIMKLGEALVATTVRAQSLSDLLELMRDSLGGVLLHPKASVDDIISTLEPALEEFARLYLEHGVGVGSPEEVLFARRMWILSERLKQLIDEENQRRKADSPPASPAEGHEARCQLLQAARSARFAVASLMREGEGIKGTSLLARDARLRTLGASDLGSVREAWTHGALRMLPLFATLPWAGAFVTSRSVKLPASEFDAMSAFCLAIAPQTRGLAGGTPGVGMPKLIAELLSHPKDDGQLLLFLQCALEMGRAEAVAATLAQCALRRVNFDEAGIETLPRMIWQAVEAPYPLFSRMLTTLSPTRAFAAWLQLRTDQNESLLHIAVRSDDERAGDLLRAARGLGDALVRSRDASGRTPWMLAMELGHVGAAAALAPTSASLQQSTPKMTAALVNAFCPRGERWPEPVSACPALLRAVEALMPAMAFAAAWRDDADALDALLRLDEKLYSVRNANDETLLHCIARANANAALRVVARTAPVELFAQWTTTRDAQSKLPEQSALNAEFAQKVRLSPAPTSPRSPTRPHWWKKPSAPAARDAALLPMGPPNVGPLRSDEVSARMRVERREFVHRLFAQRQRTRRERMVKEFVDGQAQWARENRHVASAAALAAAHAWALDGAWELIEALNQLDQEHAFGHGLAAVMPRAAPAPAPALHQPAPMPRFLVGDGLALLRMRARALQLAEHIDDDDFTVYMVMGFDPELQPSGSTDSSSSRTRRTVQFFVRRSRSEELPHVHVLRATPVECKQPIESWTLWQLNRL